MNPVYICPPYFPKINAKIILPFTSRSSFEWFLPVRISAQNLCNNRVKNEEHFENGRENEMGLFEGNVSFIKKRKT
jgi:hypothetical protein